MTWQVLQINRNVYESILSVPQWEKTENGSQQSKTSPRWLNLCTPTPPATSSSCFAGPNEPGWAAAMQWSPRLNTGSCYWPSAVPPTPLFAASRHFNKIHHNLMCASGIAKYVDSTLIIFTRRSLEKKKLPHCIIRSCAHNASLVLIKHATTTQNYL